MSLVKRNDVLIDAPKLVWRYKNIDVYSVIQTAQFIIVYKQRLLAVVKANYLPIQGILKHKTAEDAINVSIYDAFLIFGKQKRRSLAGASKSFLFIAHEKQLSTYSPE